MQFKPDWEEAQEHLVAWWEHSHYRRVTLAVRAPRPVDLPPLRAPADVQVRWLDPEYRIAAAERAFASTHFGGEAFPWFDANIGPGSLALYLGSPGVLHETTVWYEPVADCVANLPKLRYDGQNEWWRANLRLVNEGMKRGTGRYLTSYPDLIENLDIVASLIGTQPLLYALIDDPGGVKRVNGEVNELYFRYYDALYELLDGPRLGTCFSAFQVWGPGRVAKLQCDFSAMISPEMFREFVVPGLTEQVSRLDYAVYHLDGPHAVGHVGALLDIPGVNAIQWTPGAEAPGVEDECWWRMYRRILGGGKGLLLLGAAFDGVEALARELGPDGVYIGTSAPSIEAADDLLARATKW